MSFLDSIGNAFSDAADVVGDVAKDAVKVGEGAIDIAGNVAKDMAESTIDGLKHTFDSPMSVLKAAAFATILSPISLGVTLYELGDDIYKETDKEISKK
jgi:hypothetical protein